MMPEPIMRRSVFAAAKARLATEPTRFAFGGTGRTGSSGSIMTRCSALHTDSYPSCSADTTTRSMARALLSGPVLNPKNP